MNKSNPKIPDKHQEPYENNPTLQIAKSMGPEHEGRSSGESIWPEIKNSEVETDWTYKKYSVFTLC